MASLHATDPYEGSYDLTDPQSFNRYAYVQNDPVNFVDPLGLDECGRGDWCIIDITPDGNPNGGGGGGFGGDTGIVIVDHLPAAKLAVKVAEARRFQCRCRPT